MLDPTAIEFSDADFSGHARLFPLPNLVMFPHVIQPLHIFEDRYREMMHDALSGDKLLAMCLLSPGWEQNYDSRPGVYPVACLGRIVSWHKLDDGRYNLLLAGMRRVKIVSEIDNGRSFREAHVELCGDAIDSEQLRQEELRQRLAAAFENAVAKCLAGDQPQELMKLFESSLPLAALTDILAYTLDFELSFKQELLAETCIVSRAKSLLMRLDEACSPAKSPRPFPPNFSEN